MQAKHLTMNELKAGLEHIRRSPANDGMLQLIARRPAIGKRELLQKGQLDPVEGLEGDNWKTRDVTRNQPRDPNPMSQLTIMNSRVADLVAGIWERWALAGDQLYIDLDLSLANLPAGTRLAIGSAVVEVTPEPHTGCKKFVERFGMEAMLFVNGTEGRALCLRGINTQVIQAGPIRLGDAVIKQ